MEDKLKDLIEDTKEDSLAQILNRVQALRVRRVIRERKASLVRMAPGAQVLLQESMFAHK